MIGGLLPPVICFYFYFNLNNMKNLLFISAFVLTSLSLAHTQDFSIGPTVGINYAWLADAPGDTEGLIGFNAGVTMVYSDFVHWGLGLDVKYSAEGGVTKQGGEIAQTHLNYVRVPLKIYHFFNELGDYLRPKIYIGPSFGYLIGGKTEQFLGVNTITFNSKDLYEPIDLGVLVGAGFNFSISDRTWFNFDVAYAHGLTNIAKADKVFNRNLNLNLGVAWGLY